MHVIHLKIAAGLLATIGCSLAARPAPVVLGSAKTFAILANTRVFNTPTSAITGDVGVASGNASSLSNFGLVRDASQQFSSSAQVNGRVMVGTDEAPTPQLLAGAAVDMQAAFTDAMGRPGADFVGLQNGRIVGANLVPGIYKWKTAVTIAGDITLTGSSTDTWIFQISSSFNQETNRRITLAGGALPQNVVWAIAGIVTIGANTLLQGNILATGNVEVGANAVHNGCIYALTTVELNMATISCPGAVVVPPPPTTTFAPGCAATSTPTPSAAACATVAFKNLNASIHGDDFLTFTLTETVEECLDFCACLPGGQCGFANPNFDNAKNTTMLTCAVYAGCHTVADATNTGGQSLPGGGVSTVTKSSGFCLKGCTPRR
ncbi:hypothetical protein C8J57DRAFT_329927 [Mycena rebaudengoi]|nr:hypothetical protein C8J57DRAFT_329927 [Mycena rebaudengoi]